jgi:hypothetical protein
LAAETSPAALFVNVLSRNSAEKPGRNSHQKSAPHVVASSINRSFLDMQKFLGLGAEAAELRVIPLFLLPPQGLLRAPLLLGSAGRHLSEPLLGQARAAVFLIVGVRRKACREPSALGSAPLGSVKVATF